MSNHLIQHYIESFLIGKSDIASVGTIPLQRTPILVLQVICNSLLCWTLMDISLQKSFGYVNLVANLINVILTC